MRQYYPGINTQFILPNKIQGERVLQLQKICFFLIVADISVKSYLYLHGKNMNVHTVDKIIAANTILSGIPSICLSIFFIIWMYRAYANLHNTGITQVKHAKVWAWLSWFIPILNLIRPYVMLKEIWYWQQCRFRDSEFTPKGHSALRNWWISAFAPLLAIVILSMINGPNSDSVKEYYLMLLVVSAVQALPLYCFYNFMKQITPIEEDFAERFEIHQKEQVVSIANKYLNDEGNSEAITVSENEFTDHLSNSGSANVAVRSSSVYVQPLRISLWLALCCFALISFSEIYSDSFAQLVYWLTVLASVVCVAIFISWLNRAYKNLLLLQTEKLSVSPDLFATWWFIPIGNFYIPYLMLRDLRLHLQVKTKLPQKELEPLPIVDWSWMSLILSIIFIVISKLLGSSDYLNPSDRFLMTLLSRGASVSICLAIAGGIYCLGFFAKWEQAMLSRTD